MTKEEARQLARQKLIQKHPELAGVFATKDSEDKLDKVINELQKDRKLGLEGFDVTTIKGDKGDKGDRGEQGEQGEQGIQGVQGIQGTIGETGERGDKGERGNDGIDGLDGLDGKPGKDGSSDTPQQIADKINTLDGVLEYRTIKNMPTPDDLARQLKGKMDISDIKNWNQPARGRLDQRWHGGGSGTGSGTPALPFNSLQYNNSGAFGGTSNILIDDLTSSIKWNGALGAAYLDIRTVTDTQQGIRIEGDAADGIAFNTFVTGDSFLRFGFLSGGELKWGDGTAPGDITLSRTGTQTLGISGGLIVEGNLVTNSSLKILEGGSTPGFYTIFQGSNQSADITYALPPIQASGVQVLTNNGTGALSWTTATTGTVTSVSGTANRITSTGGTTPVIDISASYIGQISLTTVGTLTTGTWTASTIGVPFGGTGKSSWIASGVLYASGTTTLTNSADLNWNGNFLGVGVAGAAKLHLGGTISAPQWGGNGIVVRIESSTYTDTSSAGAVSTVSASTIGTPTFAASSPTTFNTAATMYFTGAPVAGTNVTITNPYTIYVNSGNVYFQDNLSVIGHTTFEGVTSTGATGTGKLVYDNSPTLTTASLGSSTATTQSPNDNSTKLATTSYVDNAILSQNYKEAVKYASTAALPSIVYANGSSGVGATITGVALAAISLDGASPGVGDRVLIKNQVSDFQNGIYIVTQTGSGIAVFILTRSSDADQSSDYKTGNSVFVTSGNTLSATTWAYTGIDLPTMGTTSITYVQVAGQGSFTGGNGITITGTSIAINTAITADLTTVQTFTNKTLTSPKINENVALTTTATKLNFLTSAGGTTGTTSTNIVFSTSPTLITPVLGAATGTSLALSGAIGQLGGSTGASLSAASGVLTLAGIGNTNNENLTLNFEGTANGVTLSTSTGVTNIFVPTVTLWTIGHTAYLGRLGEQIDLVGTTGARGGISLSNFDNTAATPAPILEWNVSKSATKGVQTVLVSGDQIGNIIFRGSDGTAFIGGAQIRALVDGTPGTNDMPGRLEFLTTADGASTSTIRLTIDNAGLSTFTGNLTVGTSNSITAGTIELGAASDTTIARSSAGVISVEGVVVDTISAANVLSNKTLTAPKIVNGGFLADANGNELIIFTTTASSVNDITYANAATGNNPSITASGETNVGLVLSGKGTRGVIMNNAMTEKVVTVTDGAGAVIDSSLGNLFTWTAAADRTAGTTTNPTTGQKMIICFIASGGARTLTLPTATTGDFAYGSDITVLTQTASGKGDLIGCVYGLPVANRWNVAAYVKGY